MLFKNSHLEKRIADSLLDRGEFVLPFFDQRFTLKFMSKNKIIVDSFDYNYKEANDLHKVSAVILCDNKLKKDDDEDFIIGYKNFKGFSKKLKYYDKDQKFVREFSGFEAVFDYLNLAKKIKDQTNKFKASISSFFLDADYRNSGSFGFKGLGVCLVSSSFLVMREIARRECDVIDDEDIFFALRIYDGTFLNKFYDGFEGFRNFGSKEFLKSRDVYVKFGVKCPICVGKS